MSPKPTFLLDPDPQTWDQFVAHHPTGHILQLSAWGELKSQFGWRAERVALSIEGCYQAGAQILYRDLPAGLGRLAYIPKGPLVDWEGKESEGHKGDKGNKPDKPVTTLLAFLNNLDARVRAQRGVALTVEPDLPDEPRYRRQLVALGFRSSLFGAIQPRRTIVVDIAPDEDAILAAMKQKTRYNVRLAMRKGVVVRAATPADLPAFHRLMARTAARSAFGVHAPAYYELAYNLFVPRHQARLLLAEVEGEPVAALMVFALPPRSWYFYGASGDAHRDKMAPYLLQWEAIRWAKAQGCTTYDLWGVPDEDVETLEAEFTKRSDGLWGVYRFKRGFGGQPERSVGAWDRVYAPLRYGLLTLGYRLMRMRSGR